MKRARYEAAGRPSYWVVDVDAVSLTAGELRGESYAQVARVRGDEVFAADRPYPVALAPSSLIR